MSWLFAGLGSFGAAVAGPALPGLWARAKGGLAPLKPGAAPGTLGVGAMRPVARATAPSVGKYLKRLGDAEALSPHEEADDPEFPEAPAVARQKHDWPTRYQPTPTQDRSWWFWPSANPEFQFLGANVMNHPLDRRARRPAYHDPAHLPEAITRPLFGGSGHAQAPEVERGIHPGTSPTPEVERPHHGSHAATPSPTRPADAGTHSGPDAPQAPSYQSRFMAEPPSAPNYSTGRGPTPPPGVPHPREYARPVPGVSPPMTGPAVHRNYYQKW